MELNKVYSFFFQPLSVEHSPLIQVLSTTTIIALSVFTAGIYLLIFGIINLKNYQISQIYDEDPKISQIRSTKLYRGDDRTISSKMPLFVNTTIQKPSVKNLRVDQDKLNHLKQLHKEWIRLFEVWANDYNWQMFTPKHSHYDWWVFPINRSSVGYGDKYTINEAEIAVLKSDPEFMKDYRRGVHLVVQSWGWDLDKKQPIQDPQASQVWSGYGVRLGKMADSLYLFGEKQLYFNLQEFFIRVCEAQRDQFPIEDWIYTNLFRPISHM